ncbi:MAG TPA: zinc-binding dehydrogenase [Steroidobacteraceae bacterium]|nr:zinc-binding dehydrogenase [Steroidobacteraceae bacterium]
MENLKRLGADTVINYKAVPDWGQKAKDLTAGRGVDHVIEVGGPGTLTQSITACRTGGHIALIGVLTGFAAEVSIPALFSNQIRISGISIGSRSGGHDSVDNGQSFEARYRPPFSAAGNRRCLQVLRIPTALWQDLPRTLRSTLSEPRSTS